MHLNRYCAALISAVFAGSIVSAPATASTTTPGRLAPWDPSYTIGVPMRSDIRDIGAMPANSMVQISVNLKYRHANELDRDIAAVSTKHSPLYHHFLSNAQWNAYFAPSETQVQAVALALTRAGFHVDSIASNRSLLQAQGTAATVDRYFQTAMHLVEQNKVGVRYRNSAPASLPQELRGLVVGVSGLNDLVFHVARPLTSGHSHSLSGKPATSQYTPPTIGGPIQGGDGGYGPVVLANQYNYPVQHGYNGHGHTVGVTIPQGKFLDTDTHAYLNYFGITHGGVVTRMAVDGGNPVNELDGESTLDVETISGLAPGANVDVYIAPTWTVRYVNDSFNQVVADNFVESVSNSWGFCETQDASDWDNASIHQIFEQGAMKGITFIFSSGDGGSNSDGYPNCVSSPADDPYVLALGGVHITVDNTTGQVTNTQGTWYDCGGRKYAGSGGGVSALYPLPSYQNGYAVVASGRNVPDISLPADCEDTWFIDGGFYGPIGGTSWAAPAFNAMLIEINQVLGSRSGWVNQSIYAAYGVYGKSVITNVIHGSNGSYSDAPGYNLVNGLGTPNGMALATDL